MGWWEGWWELLGGEGRVVKGLGGNGRGGGVVIFGGWFGGFEGGGVWGIC